MLIESIKNEKIKYYSRLKEIKYIKKYKEFIVEGEHLVEEAIKSGYAKEIIILDKTNYNTQLPRTYVNEKVLKYISTLDTPQHLMAVCKTLESENKIFKKTVLLDEISDPGNLGTIIRTCVAFGVDAIVLGNNSVSIYNDKVIRSSQGMIFNINIIQDDLKNYIKRLKEESISVYGTDLKGSKALNKISIPSKYALVLGNEASGVGRDILSLCDEKILIEMKKECESLNVAIAAAIILYEWR